MSAWEERDVEKSHGRRLPAPANLHARLQAANAATLIVAEPPSLDRAMADSRFRAERIGRNPYPLDGIGLRSMENLAEWIGFEHPVVTLRTDKRLPGVDPADG